MASSSTISCGSTSSTTTSIPLNTPLLLRNNDSLFENITHRIPDFPRQFDTTQFAKLLDRVEGTLPLHHAAESDLEDGSTPRDISRFANLITSPDLYGSLRMGGAPRSQLRVDASTGFPSPLAAPLPGDYDGGGPCRVDVSPRVSASPRVLDETGKVVGPSLPINSPAQHNESSPVNLDLPRQSTPRQAPPEGFYVGNINIGSCAAPPSTNSFVDSKRTILHYVPPEIVNGNTFVKPSWSEATMGMKRWDSTIVGYFIGKKLPFKSVREHFLKTWAGVKSIKATIDGFDFFTFESAILMQEVLEEGPWLYSGQTLFLQKWKLGMTLEKRTQKALP